MLNAFHAIVRTARLPLTALLALGFIFGCAKKEPTAPEALAEAQALHDSGHLSEAIAVLENFERDHPGDFDVIEALAFSYVEAGDPEVAALYFTRAAQIDQSQAEYLLMAAEAWRNSGDPETAIATFQDYLLLREDDRSARLALADLYLEQGQVDSARNTLIQINATAPDGDVQARIGQLFLEGNNLAQAQQWFNSAAAFGGEPRAKALLGLLQVAVQAKRFSDAEELVAVLDREFPGRLDESPLADLRGQLATWRARQDAATAAAAQIAATPATPSTPPATPPESTPPATTQASTPTTPSQTRPPQTATTASNPPAEENALLTPTPADPDSPEFAVTDPADYPEPPDKEERVAAVERELDAPPASSADENAVEPGTLFPSDNATGTQPRLAAQGYAGFVAAGREAAAAGRWAEAIKNFQRALARSSADPQIWFELSEAQFRNGDVRIAPTSASEAIRRAPQHPRYRLQYLRVVQSTISSNRLLQEMERARQDFPHNPDFALVLARAHRELGNVRFARRYFEEFLRLAPPNHPERGAVETELNQLP